MKTSLLVKNLPYWWLANPYLKCVLPGNGLAARCFNTVSHNLHQIHKEDNILLMVNKINEYNKQQSTLISHTSLLPVPNSCSFVSC